MLFEIINPSDAYTMEASDLETAAVAVVVLGHGMYGLRGLGDADGKDVPVFILGGHDEWFATQFGRLFEESVDRVDRAALASALGSVKLSNGERTSMNNIGAKAHRMASLLREQLGSVQ